MRTARRTLALLPVLAGCLLAGDRPSSRPADDTEPRSDLDYWLQRAEPVETRPADQEDRGYSPFQQTRPGRDAVPGVVRLSDGTLLAGTLYTTREKPWLVYVAEQKRWRRIPLVTVLGIQAIVVQEKMQLQWRWKGMGEPEKVYTGRKYPTRRFRWRFHLIDGSYVTGAVKGQPLRVKGPDRQRGPLVLHERSKGEPGQGLDDLVYVQRVIVSRRMMQRVLEAQRGEGATSRPASRKGEAERPVPSADSADRAADQ